MKRPIFYFLLLYPVTSFGQDISGKWVGQFDKSTYPLLELDITTIQNKTFTGTLTAHMAGDKYQRYAISGKYDSLKKTIYFKEDSGIAVIVVNKKSGVSYKMKRRIVIIYCIICSGLRKTLL